MVLMRENAGLVEQHVRIAVEILNLPPTCCWYDMPQFKLHIQRLSMTCLVSPTELREQLVMELSQKLIMAKVPNEWQ